MRKHPRHRNLLKDDQPLEILEYENANIDFSGIAGNSPLNIFLRELF